MDAKAFGIAAPTTRPKRLRADDVFFGSMAVVVLATVVFGFSHSYFMAGMVRAKLPSVLVHLHGAAFSLWIVLFVFQTGLVIARRVRFHRVLGVAGAVLAVSMVVLGILATSALIRRGASPVIFAPAVFLAINDVAISIFGGLVAAAVWYRRNGAVHKRLMLLATIDILAPAITRWPVALIQAKPGLVGLVMVVLILSVLVYDLCTRRRPYAATVVATLLTLSVQPVATVLGKTPLLQHMVAELQAGR